ncbi:MAG: 4Fe-4S binding protein [Bacteroidales bacterium]|nr:4Fe-4S binding protein [Bacteroidales bacterium]
MISRVETIYYSPTGTSGKIAEAVAEAFVKQCAETAWAVPSSGVTDLTLGVNPKSFDNTFAVIAAPVYGGRVAPTAIGRLREISAGSNSLCAVIAVYGNRDYEDALLELVNEARSCGFVPVAAGAFIGEHSYSTEEYPIAQDRPDSQDLDKCMEFGRELSGFYSGKLPENLELPDIKGNFPYKEYNPSPATPQTDVSRCVLCGRCIDMCPVGCIEMMSAVAMGEESEVIVSNPAVCTKCCACVKGCPFGARVYNTPYSEMLHKNFGARKEPEWFIAGRQ